MFVNLMRIKTILTSKSGERRRKRWMEELHRMSGRSLAELRDATWDLVEKINHDGCQDSTRRQHKVTPKSYGATWRGPCQLTLGGLLNCPRPLTAPDSVTTNATTTLLALVFLNVISGNTQLPTLSSSIAVSCILNSQMPVLALAMYFKIPLLEFSTFGHF